jgi:opacity protein-like surface antigen
MKKVLFSSLVVVLFAAQLASAHDPRTVAKNFSHTLTVEGAGKLTLSYKSLHFNEQGFNNRKQERMLTNFNRLWKSIGKLDTDFDIVVGGVQVPKGSYTLGFNFDANDNFKLVLSGGGKDIMVPLQAAMDGPTVNYLSFDVRPDNETDTLILEARYGKLRASANATVPYLAPHEHTDKKNF